MIAPNWAWGNKVHEFLKRIENIQANWQEKKDNFDLEHLEQLLEMENQVMASVAKANECLSMSSLTCFHLCGDATFRNLSPCHSCRFH
jgi:hypothetical protein